MGEYALYNGREVKIGTCECMYYLRYEDRGKVEPMRGSLDPSKETGLFWRLPFPDEDEITPGGNYENHKRGALLVNFNPEFSDDELDPGIIQLHHPSGLLVNFPCYHGLKLPAPPPNGQTFWNGKDPHAFELVFIKNLDGGKFRPVYRCKFCDHMWSCDAEKWLDLREHLIDLKLAERLDKYFPFMTRKEPLPESTTLNKIGQRILSA